MKSAKIRNTVNRIAGMNGFSYYSVTNKLIGNSPVSVGYNRIFRKGDEEFLIFIIGIDPKLPAGKRRELWLSEGLRLVSLCELTLDVDRELFKTNEDGRTFAVRVW